MSVVDIWQLPQKTEIWGSGVASWLYLALGLQGLAGCEENGRGWDGLVMYFVVGFFHLADSAPTLPTCIC